jgi:selenocysteine lyase/cysteine desulfurase
MSLGILAPSSTGGNDDNLCPVSMEGEMMERRSFLGTLGRGFGAATVTTLFNPGTTRRVEASSRRIAGLTPDEAARDETYWGEIQQAFSVTRSLINLNHGGVGSSPRIVTEALVRYIWEQEEAPVYTMWEILEPRREVVRVGLAKLFGCDPEEIALVRNASEALEILLMGIDLQSGDEVVTTEHDYPRMRTTLDQRSRREGIELKTFPVATPGGDPDVLVEGFERAISPKTKMILVSHQVNITGQIFPVKRICDLARQRGIEVIVDGAHTFAQFTFKQSDLGCDFYGTSLHKWLLAPKGTGMLYVRRDKIKNVWPLMAAPDEMNEDIRKFEEIGTHPAANEVATGEALTFHHAIGPDRNEARLRYLKDYWAKRLLEIPNIRLHTSLEPEASCAIATVEIVGVDTEALDKYLWDKHQIIVAPILREDFQGLRVTPGHYSTLRELDYFCEVMEHIAKKGLPKSA